MYYIIPYGIYISTINYFDMREIASAESKQFIKEHYDVRILLSGVISLVKYLDFNSVLSRKLWWAKIWENHLETKK